MERKLVQGESLILGLEETISRGFAKEKVSKNTKKRHLWSVMTIERKKIREQYKCIYFMEEDFEDVNRDHNKLMVILMLAHNFINRQILVN